MSWFLRPEACDCGRIATLRIVQRELRADVRVDYLTYQCACGRMGGLAITEPEAAAAFREAKNK